MLKSTIFFTCLIASTFCHIHAQSNVWEQLPGPYGGNIYSAAQLNNAWYIGTGSGVFSSDDEGENWQRLGWPQEGQIVTSMLLEPAEYIVAATIVDLDEYATDSWLGLVYHSNDQGQHWSVDTIRSDFSYGPFNLKIFRQRGFLFASDHNLLLRSSDNGQTWEDILGFNLNFQYFDFNDSLLLGDDGFSQPQYSKDGGENWIPLTPPSGAFFGNYALGVGNTIFYFDSFDPCYRTTNLGNTWQSIGTPFGYSDINTCKVLPNGKLAALVEYPDNDEMIFTSSNNGLNWQKYNGNPAALPLDVVANGAIYGVATANGFYKNFINGNFLNPSNNGITASNVSSQVMHAGQFLDGSTDGLWRSFDGGTNWFSSFPQSQLAGTKEVRVKGDTLCAITGANFFYSSDGGDSWINPYVSGGWGFGGPFDEAQNFALDGDALVVSGFDLYNSSDYGQNWEEYSDFSRCSGAVVAEGKYFALAYWDGIVRSNDQGASWQVVKNSILGQGRMYYLHNKVFACIDQGLLRSSNLGTSWTTPSGIPTHGIFDNPLPVTAMAANDTVIYAAVNFAGIYKSTDDGSSWSLFSADLPNLRFNDLLLDKGVLYAACSGGGIWKYNLNMVGTHAPSRSQRVSIWPNPVGTQGIQLNCSSGFDEAIQITVYNALGQQILSQSARCNADKIELTIRDLTPGLYRLVAKTGDQLRIGSFIKIED